MSPGSRLVLRIVLVVILIFCGVLLFNGIRQAGSGNWGPLVTLIVAGALGAVVDRLRARR